MRGRSEQRLEEMLRTGTGRARRDPSPALRSKIRAAIEAAGSEAAGSEVDREPFAGSASRGRRRAMTVAAAVLVAVGLGVFGYFQSGRENVHPALPSGPTGSSQGFARLALAGQRSLRIAVDDPLLTELEGIAADATRTARFLARRVPKSLVTPKEEDRGR